MGVHALGLFPTAEVPGSGVTLTKPAAWPRRSACFSVTVAGPRRTRRTHHPPTPVFLHCRRDRELNHTGLSSVQSVHASEVYGDPGMGERALGDVELPRVAPCPSRGRRDNNEGMTGAGEIEREPSDGSAVVAFETQRAFEVWLREHRGDEPAVWVKFAKKGTGIASVTLPEAVEVALCFGWIDSLMHRYDDNHYVLKYSPRRSGSNWSARTRTWPSDSSVRVVCNPPAWPRYRLPSPTGDGTLCESVRSSKVPA